MVKHCPSCRQEFLDRAESCPDCEVSVLSGPVPDSPDAERGEVPFAPLLAFATDVEARVALAKLDACGIVGEIAPFGSTGALGNELEGKSTGVPVIVPVDRREEALRVLAERDPEDDEILEAIARHGAEAEAEDERSAGEVPDPALAPPRYSKSWFSAAFTTICAVATTIIALLALLEDVTTVGFEGVDLELAWSGGAALAAAWMLLIGLRIWLGVIYRNVHAFAGEPVDATGISLGIVKAIAPLVDVGSTANFLALKLGRAPMPRALLLAPLGLFVFFVFDRMAALVGASGGDTAGGGVAIVGHALLLLSSGAAVLLTLRLGAQHREVAFRWPGPGASADW